MIDGILVVVDTNVWISALINLWGPPARLMQAVLSGRIRLVLSSPMIAEIQGVVHRNRIRRRITLNDQELDAYFSAMSRGSVLADVSGGLRVCRDPKDDLIVETAIAGGARYLVSRDEDLTRDLDLVNALREHGVDVLTVARFLELLDAQQH